MISNILLTGANGQLGSEIRKLAPLFPQIALFPTDIDTLDIGNQTQVSDFIAKNSIDCIINCAAYTAVDKAESDVERCFAINRDAVETLAKAAAGHAKIIHISTDYVFDGRSSSPLSETARTCPQSVYGASKLAGEIVLHKILPDDSIVIRTAWLYSTFGNNFVKTMIRLGGERDSLNVVNDQFGSPTYAEDLAKTILQVVLYIKNVKILPAGIYHFTDEGVCTWYDFTLKIHELAGIDSCKVSPVSTAEYPTAARRPAYSVLDKTKIKTTFGISIPHWEESLARFTAELPKQKNI
jgi:dTDP-4-dehydrorhamnose reductase